MDQALAVVIGAAIGSIGAAGTAFVTAWAGRQQASIQASSQENQWRRQVRRDAYSALLHAGAEARDELGSLWEIIRDADSAANREWIIARYEETKPLMNAVRVAAATVFIEGPISIIEPARRVDEGIFLFRTAISGVIKPRSAESATLCTAICFKQRVGVRNALIDFASAAREAIDGETRTATPPFPIRSGTDSTQELAWLIEGMAGLLGIPETKVNSELKISDFGLDSLSSLELRNKLSRSGLRLSGDWLYDHWDDSLLEVADALAVLRGNRS